ncbi:hypothetical protein [Nocardia sp. NPDC023988]|uniref:hypothetical protein n=1 Tax=unclassified Nocardia TaxID=2637762 RepID=UPI0033CD059C
MGYDVSFHAIDMRMVENRVLPYIAGYGTDEDLHDLIRFGVEQTKVRFRANAWGLGALEELGGNADFDPQLYVWGRPYFVTAQTPDDVAETVLQYNRCTPEQVDHLAVQQLSLLDRTLVGRVRPNMEGTLPPDRYVAEAISGKVVLLRQAVRALRTRQSFTTPDGETADPGEILAGNLQFVLVEFLAHILPGWIQRGRVWPTLLERTAGSDGYSGLVDNSALLGLMRSEFPALEWAVNYTIPSNYEVGGYAAPAAVPVTRHWLARKADELVAAGDEDDEGDVIRTAIRKTDEALALAARIGGAFVEASEIYIPMEGTMN